MRPFLITNPTRNKLEEAIFFLEEMKENIENEKQFCWFLSAFLQAARSITFFMQRQFGKVSGFPEWYCKRQTEMIADEDMTYLNKARVETVHKKPTTMGVIGATRLANIVDLVKAGEDPPTPKKVKPIEDKKPTSNIVGYTFADYNDKDVVPFCESQMIKLENMVIKCEEDFLTDNRI